jgi:hypothetical protein
VRQLSFGVTECVRKSIQHIPNLVAVISFLSHLPSCCIVRLPVPLSGDVDRSLELIKLPIETCSMCCECGSRNGESAEIPSLELPDSRSHQRGVRSLRESAELESAAVVSRANAETLDAIVATLVPIDLTASAAGSQQARAAENVALPSPVRCPSEEKSKQLMMSAELDHVVETLAISSGSIPYCGGGCGTAPGEAGTGVIGFGVILPPCKQVTPQVGLRRIPSPGDPP